MLPSKNALIEQVEELKEQLEEPATFMKRWSYMAKESWRAKDLGTWKIGQVIPKTVINIYDLTRFQTMKNCKLAQWVLTAGETHVSLGCADFAQLLFGRFDGDLTEKIQFYGNQFFLPKDLLIKNRTRTVVLKPLQNTKRAKKFTSFLFEQYS